MKPPTTIKSSTPQNKTITSLLAIIPSIIQSLLLFLLIQSFTTPYFNRYPTFVESTRIITATEQILGSWDVTLTTRRKALCHSVLFPEKMHFEKRRILSKPSTVILSSDDSSGSDGKQQQRGGGWRRRNDLPSSLRCLLLIKNDGTFDLVPREDVDNVNNEKVKNRSSSLSTSMVDSDRHHLISSWRTVLRGRWKIHPNPYCVTDRHHDEISLISYPRARIWSRRHIVRNQQEQLQREYHHYHQSDDKKRRHIINVTNELERGSLVVERERIELRAKVWGRYYDGNGDGGGVGVINDDRDDDGGSIVPAQPLWHRRRRRGPRLTHGTILAVRSGSRCFVSCPKWCWWQRRVVLGTFRGRAIEDMGMETKRGR